MIVGRPGDTITLQFSRPGSSKPTPWRITLPRVLPRQPARIESANSKLRAAPSAPASPLLNGAKVESTGTSPVVLRGPEVGVRVVVSTSEVWNDRYGHQEQQEAELKRQVIIEFRIITSPGVWFTKP